MHQTENAACRPCRCLRTTRRRCAPRSCCRWEGGGAPCMLQHGWLGSRGRQGAGAGTRCQARRAQHTQQVSSRKGTSACPAAGQRQQGVLPLPGAGHARWVVPQGWGAGHAHAGEGMEGARRRCALCAVPPSTLCCKLLLRVHPQAPRLAHPAAPLYAHPSMPPLRLLPLQAMAILRTWPPTGSWCWTTLRTRAAPTSTRRACGASCALAAASLSAPLLRAHAPGGSPAEGCPRCPITAHPLHPPPCLGLHFCRSRTRSGGLRWLPSGTRASTSASTSSRPTACARCEPVIVGAACEMRRLLQCASA